MPQILNSENNKMDKFVEAESYSHLVKIVNPNSKSLRVYYPGSGGDLLTPVLTTNSDRFVYVDEYTLKEGYAGPHTQRIEEEARAMGIEEIIIEDNGKNATINFDYQHKQDKLLKHREIVFYARDAFNFWPSEFEGGYDILITRGEAPTFIGHDIQMKQLGTKMDTGGFFISDREIARYLLPQWIGFEEISNNTTFPCGRAKIYRKSKQENKELLSNLFNFDDLVWDIISYVRGGNPYTIWKSIDPSNLAKRIRDSGKPLKPTFFDDFYKSLENMKKKFGNELTDKFYAMSKVYKSLPKKVKEEARDRLSCEFSQQYHPEAFKLFHELIK